MRMLLETMRIENFKGCRSLKIDFAADRTMIAGANGTGKTTIVDAFCWVLNNQNANGDAPGSDNFREKPLDDNGQPIHNLDTTVELRCTLDGQRFDLKRTQTENWVKKRGNAEATFQGNVSTYWINGVETKLQDFKARIKAIADDEIFRLISSLSAFNNLEWKKRRAQLMALAGDDVDGELLMRDEYRPLADQLAERNISADDMRKVLADQKKAINNELKLLPVRIDEAKKSISEFGKTEIKDAEYLVKDSKADIEKINNQIIELRTTAGASNAGQIFALEQEIVTIKHGMIAELSERKKAAQAKVDNASEDFRKICAMQADVKHDLEQETVRLDKAEAELTMMREKYLDHKRRKIEVNEVCPTCGQVLPAGKVDAARTKAEVERREQLAKIQADGKTAAITANRIAENVAKLQENLAYYGQRVEAAQTARGAAFAEQGQIPAEPDFAGNMRLVEAERQLEALRAEKTFSPDEKIKALNERKEELTAIVNRNLSILSKRDIAVETEQRIKSYENRQRELGVQLADTEMMIILLEKFIQDRCGALEDSINSHFPTVRWKLFEIQINGGITDACTCMIPCDGALVPYESANTASQIAADIEIVDVLSEHYDIRVPLFVDGAESVNILPQIDSQMIALAVSTDAELTVS